MWKSFEAGKDIVLELKEDKKAVKRRHSQSSNSPFFTKVKNMPTLGCKENRDSWWDEQESEHLPQFIHPGI